MSTVYATEPSPSGRLVLETTHGPLDVELWCRECPLTTRWILQLVLDGFFNDCIFHRILPSTLIQTGALRLDGNNNVVSPATAGSNVDHKKQWHEYRLQHDADRALERRRFELNSRLRFSHRGLVALALPLDETDSQMQPQLFITLEEAPYLDGKHVIFGRITGPTVFNALRIGRTDIGEEGDAQQNDVNYKEAPRILRAKILDNPLHTDLTPSTVIPWKATNQADPSEKKNKKRRKGKLDVNVLSFGDEMGGGDMDGEEADAARPRTMKPSSHLEEDNAEQDNDRPRKKKKKEKKKRSKHVDDKDEKEGADDKPSSEDQNELAIDGEADQDEELQKQEEEEPFQPRPIDEKAIKAALQAVASQASSNKPATHGGGGKAKHPATKLEKKTNKDKKLSGASLLEAMRNQSHFASAASRSRAMQGARKRRSRNNSNDDPEQSSTYSKLMAFQGRMGSADDGGQEDASNIKSAAGAALLDPKDDSLAARMARKALLEAEQQLAAAAANRRNETESYHGQVLEDRTAQADQSWMSTVFHCRKHMDLENKDGMGGDGRCMDEYQVVDDRKQQRGKNDSISRHHHRRLTSHDECHLHEKRGGDWHEGHHDHRDRRQRDHNRRHHKSHHRSSVGDGGH